MARKKKQKPHPAEEDHVPEDEPPPVIDLDLDLDAGRLSDVEGLVAAVANFDEDDVVFVDRVEEAVEDDPVSLDDVDAVLDDEPADSVALQALIALTAAGGDPEDDIEPPPAEPLDDDLPVEVLGDEPGLHPTALASVAAAVVAESPKQDLEEAIDLGPISTPELRERLLAQALAHSALQDARYRVPFSGPRVRGRWKGVTASLILLVAAIVAVLPPQWVRPDPPAELNAGERMVGLRTALLLQAQQVDAYRVRFQRLPNSLDDLPSRLPGLRFVKSGNRAYQLIGYERSGNAVIYDSSNPSPQFTALALSWTEGPVQ